MPRALKPEFQACKHIDALLGGNRRRQWAVLKMIGEALQTAVQSDPQVVVSLSFVVGDEDDSLGLPEIPQSVLTSAVRRLSYYPRFDITDATDITIARYYPGLKELMNGIYGTQKGQKFLARVSERWADRVREGTSNLFLARRINIGAPGTHHIAAYTRVPSFVGGSIWGFRGLTEDDAKILCLWFNSSLFLLLVSDFRKQIGGTWWVLDKHRVAQTKIPDLRLLSASQRNLLLTLFEDLRTVPFPSVVEQLRTSFDGRRRVDSVWMTVLGVPANDHPGLLTSLYASLYGTLRSLLGAMGTE